MGGLAIQVREGGHPPGDGLMEALGITEIPDILPTEEANEPLPTAA